MIASTQTPHPLPPLETLQDAAWNLEDFVAEVNKRLFNLQQHGYGDAKNQDARQNENFTIRLLRHYANLGLVSEAEKLGREARYRYRHLLQVLCLRALQRQGWNSKAIADFSARENTDLETFLNGQTDSLNESAQTKLPTSETVLPQDAPAGLAMPSPARKKSSSSQERASDFLKAIKSRESQPRAEITQKQQVPAPLPQFLLHDPPKSPERWRRIEIAPGLEVHISDRYRQARHNSDKRRLLERLEQAIESNTEQNLEQR